MGGDITEDFDEDEVEPPRFGAGKDEDSSPDENNSFKDEKEEYK